MAHPEQRKLDPDTQGKKGGLPWLHHCQTASYHQPMSQRGDWPGATAESTSCSIDCITTGRDGRADESPNRLNECPAPSLGTSRAPRRWAVRSGFLLEDFCGHLVGGPLGRGFFRVGCLDIASEVLTDAHQLTQWLLQSRRRYVDMGWRLLRWITVDCVADSSILLLWIAVDCVVEDCCGLRRRFVDMPDLDVVVSCS